MAGSIIVKPVEALAKVCRAVPLVHSRIASQADTCIAASLTLIGAKKAELIRVPVIVIAIQAFTVGGDGIGGTEICGRVASDTGHRVRASVTTVLAAQAILI